jgi:phosphoserine aminotransferase
VGVPLIFLILMLAACVVAAEALDAALTWLESRGGVWAQTVAAQREEDKLAGRS